MDKSSYPQYGDKIGEKPVDNSVEKSKILFIQQKTLWIKMGKNGGILWESR